jgi:hypothetical protein
MIRTMISGGGRLGKRDVIIAGALSLLGVLMMLSNVSRTAPAKDQVSLVALPLFLAVTAPVAWWRTAPLPALAAVIAALAVHVAVVGTTLRCGVAFPVMFVLVYAAASRLTNPGALLSLALGLAGAALVCASDRNVHLSTLPFFAAMTAVVWGIGRVVRSRTQLAGELRTRTSELRVARDERANLEVAADRAHMASELDGLLRRRLGELARLAGEGARQEESSAATAALLEIEHESRRTLEEMRAVVGVLRGNETDAPVAPQPTLTHLEALLLRAKGTDARLTVEGSPRVLPVGVELSAYRVVEHLLDALQNAPGIEVRVSFGADALELGVSGPARGRADVRAAFVRARERVQLHRGSLQSSTRGGRAEAVALLPLLAGA